MARPVWISRKMIKATAFRSLNKWSLVVLFDFYCKRHPREVKRSGRESGWIIENNGDIVFPYSEAERQGISRRNFRNAIDELIEKGFLEINHHGGGGHKGDVTTYYLRDEWENYGKKKFNPPKKRSPDKRQYKGWAAIWNDPNKKAALLRKRKNNHKCQI